MLHNIAATGSEIKKVRPVVKISQDEMNEYLETVVVFIKLCA
jgi:mRNA-degrading endonuclease toxin of MazEF toxin-antitoxin module